MRAVYFHFRWDRLSSGDDEMDSVWTKTTQLPQFEPLSEDIKTDVLIIGGGMAGLLCAWQKQEVQFSVVKNKYLMSRTERNEARRKK